MQSPTAPAAVHRDPPFATALSDNDDGPVSPAQAGHPAIIDPLVAKAAERIAAVINDFKRELDQRDSQWGSASGTFELALQADHSQTYELTIVHDDDGAEYPISVRPAPKKGKGPPNGHRNSFAPLLAAAASSATSRPTRRASDAELERDIVSRKRRRLDVGDREGAPRKRPRTGNGDGDGDDEEDMMPLITKEDLAGLLSKLREDVEDDTSECVNHVQRLLRRFKEEWHQKTAWDDEHASARPPPGREPFRDSVVGNGVAFPSQSADRDDQNTSTSEVVRREAKLLSSQIKWVEECRRVASTIHDKREENWRTTSAGFHDRNRQDRENFQNRVLQESTHQGKILNQILNEVRTIGLYTQSMKWETPDHLSTHPAYPPQPVAPAFPTQPAQSPAGRGRGGPNKR